MDDASGLRVPVTEPRRYVEDIAAALRHLAASPALRTRLGDGARSKVAREGIWSSKAERMVDLYKEILNHQNARPVIRKG